MPTVQSEVNLKQSAKHVLPWRAQYRGAQLAVQIQLKRLNFNLKDEGAQSSIQRDAVCSTEGGGQKTRWALLSLIKITRNVVEGQSL